VSTSRELINREAQRASVLIESATMSRLTTYTVGPESIAVRFTKAGAIWSAWHRRPDGSSRAIHGGVGAVLGVLFTMLEHHPDPYVDTAEHFTTDPEAVAYERAVDEASAGMDPVDERGDPIAPASAPERGADAFEEVERSDQAAAEFERTAGRLAIGPATSAASERRPLYDSKRDGSRVSVDHLGGDTFELARWDDDEETFVHVVTLSRQEAADACYELAAAISRTAD
jgi:hypothetical protein